MYAKNPALSAGGLIPAFLIYRKKYLVFFSIRKKAGIRPPAKRAGVLATFFGVGATNLATCANNKILSVDESSGGNVFPTSIRGWSNSDFIYRN